MRNVLRALALSLLYLGSAAQARSAWSQWVALNSTLHAVPIKRGDIRGVEFRPTEDCQAVIIVHNRRRRTLTIPVDVLEHEQQYVIEGGIGVWASCSFGNVYLRVRGLYPPEPSTGA